MPNLIGLQRDYGPQGLTLVGVSADDNSALVAEFRDGHRLNFPVVLDGSTRTYFGRYSFGADVPQTLVFDRDGRLRMYIKGKPADYLKRLEQAIQTLL